MTLEDALILMIAFFFQGLGLEFAKWVFEKFRKIETKVKLNGKN